jgi:hypothetical protein
LGWRESASSPRKAVPLERRRERAVAGSTARRPVPDAGPACTARRPRDRPAEGRHPSAGKMMVTNLSAPGN